jgi:hypothetical protein
VLFERDQVRDAAAEIERLVARLCDDEHPVPAAELAAARDLACDANGPVFAWTEPGTLRRRLRVLFEAMG